jgi:carbamoyl-phosphate synthase large subunit
VIIYAISEHIENAGVHSGDATMVLPPQYTYLETVRKIKETTKKIANALKITGPFNIQFIAKDNQIKVIECNLRASRSFPFVSKVTKYNFIDLATKAMLGLDIKGKYNTIDLDYVGVKAPQFSFSRLHGADPVLSVEMASTGEVACLGNDLNEAFLKSLLSVGFVLPNSNVLLSTGPIKSKAYLLESVKKLEEMGFNLYATEGTAKFIEQNGIKTTILNWPLDMSEIAKNKLKEKLKSGEAISEHHQKSLIFEKKEPNALTYIQERKIDLVILIVYMKIISPHFVNKYRNRIMNIHPSLLPAFGGGMDKDVHKMVLESGCKVTGCTLHFVTEDVDAGPIILQRAVDIDDDETTDSLKEKVQRAEQEVLVKAITLFGEGKIKVEGERVNILG